MDKNFEKLFSYYQAPEPPANLLSKILNRIDQEKKLLSLKHRLFFFSAGLISSVALFIFALKSTLSGLAESGFTHFFSLLFSDAETILAYWQNFALSLLETLPIFSLILLFVTVLAILELLKLFSEDLKNIFNYKQLTPKGSLRN